MHTHRWPVPLLVLALLASALLAPASFAQDRRFDPSDLTFDGYQVRRSAKAGTFVPGQLLVRLRDNSAFATKAANSTSGGLQAFRARFADLKISTTSAVAPQTYRLTVAADTDIVAVAKQMAADPEVAYAQPNYKRYLYRTVNDPLSTFQYGLNKINAYGAWDITTGTSGVTIAIIDSGINLGHPEFANRLVPGFDFAYNDSDPSDDNGHGTHVAGIAAAAGDNGEGIAGMCWQCRIMPIKVTNEFGEGDDAGIASGVRWAVDRGARVINMSLGGEDESPVLQEAIRYAVSKNVLVVVAAGNSFEDGNPVEYPAAYDEVIAVGATEENDQRAFFSSVQPYIDVSAPGWNIASTWAQAGFPPTPYLAETGTSMASPYVAGLAGLLLSVNPNLDVNALRTIITSTTDDLGQPGTDWEFGAGRINAARAVAAVRVPAFEPVANPNQPDVSFFPETQHTLRGTFKAFWEQNGGLPVFGFPISEEVQETSPEGTFTVQYFERNRLELHPDKQPPYNVLLGRLSDVQLQRQGRDWFTFPKGQQTGGCQFFAETGHSVCEPFLSYWKNNGLRDAKLTPEGRSLALFGLPLSEAVPEVNSSGENVVTQWFERARFEFHPDEPQQYQVLLGLLGNETARPSATGTPASGQTPPDRCGFLPPATNATLKPGACVVVGTYFTIDASGFAPNEQLNFYLTVDGENIPLDPIQADEQGRVGLFDQALIPPGVYGIVLQGTQSGNQSVVYLKVVDR